MQNKKHKLILNQETIFNLTSAPKLFAVTDICGSVGCAGTNNCTPTKTQDLPND